MTVGQWLNQHYSGYKDSPPRLKTAVRDFSILWALFEGECLSMDAKPANIEKYLDKIVPVQLLAKTGVQTRYFIGRYIAAQDAEARLTALCGDRQGDKPLIRQIASQEPRLIAAGLIYVVRRLRNNLLHGPKWSYDLEGQYENFHNANVLLMHFLEAKAEDAFH